MTDRKGERVLTKRDVEKAMGLGARDYLLKMTTTPIKLSEKVKEILRGHE